MALAGGSTNHAAAFDELETINYMTGVLVDEGVDLDDRSEALSVLASHGFSHMALNLLLDDAIDEARDLTEF